MKIYKLGEIFDLKQWKHLPLDKLSDTWYSVFWANWKIWYYHEYMYETPVVLVSCRGAKCWAINMTEKQSWVTWNSIALINKKEEKIDNRYLYYVLVWTTFNNVISGSAQPQIIVSNLKTLQIPLPDLTTQHAIADKLDQIQSLIEKKKQVIQHTDELAKSVFLEMFGDPVTNEKGWEVKKLGEICDVWSSKRVFVDDLVEYWVPFYRWTEVWRLGANQDIMPTLFITKDHYKRLKEERGVPKVWDLLMPSICPDGRIFRVENNSPFYFKDGRVLRISVNKTNIDSIYLKNILKEIFRSSYWSIASWTTFAELKIFTLKWINIPLPPLSLQEKFADIITDIEAQKAKHQEVLKDLEELYNQQMQESFSF